MTPQELEYQAQLQGELATLRLQVAAYEAKLNSAKPVAWRYENRNIKGNWCVTWTEPPEGFNKRALYEHPPAPNAVEWISAEDQLPEQEQSVLVTRKGRSNAQITCYYGKDWVLESNHYPVTHWMPLPKPPVSAAMSGE